MKVKKVLLVAIIVLALTVPSTAFAADSASTTAVSGLVDASGSNLTPAQSADAQDARKGWRDGKGKDKIDISKLTDEQKTSLLALQKQQLNLENDLAAILVRENLITQAQADAIKTEINSKIASLSTANQSYKIMGRGMRELSLLRGVTLTDAQKTAILGWSAKSADVQKKIVALYKEAGVITQAQADTINQKIDAKAADPLAFTKKGHCKMGNKDGGNNTDSSKTGSD